MSKLIHVTVVFGTRPEAIKMAPVINSLQDSDQFRVTICSTGQHRQMLDQVLKAFNIRNPDIDLNIMSNNQSISEITSKIILEMTSVFSSLKPDIVLVHGDTTSAFAAATAAFYSRIPIGHVEAGLRSFDMRRPWPEEFNRVAIDAIADLMFAPTEQAAENLRNEYNRKSNIIVTGNTGIDALLSVATQMESSVELNGVMAKKYDYILDGEQLVLVTGHRRESFGGGFENICSGLSLVANMPNVRVVYPVHLNPNVRGVVRQKLSNNPKIHLIDPVEYLDMVWLMRRADVVVTDSGGIQEEAPALGKPVLVMRDVTERPEALATGRVALVGTDPRTIFDMTQRFLQEATYLTGKPVFPYGDGKAAGRIRSAIFDYFKVSDRQY